MIDSIERGEFKYEHSIENGNRYDWNSKFNKWMKNEANLYCRKYVQLKMAGDFEHEHYWTSGSRGAGDISVGLYTSVTKNKFVRGYNKKQY